MNVKLLALLVAGAVLCGGVAYGHHSFASTYAEDESIEIEGEIVAFMFRNPHAFVHVMAPDENGEMHRWGVEWGGAGQLGRQGVSRTAPETGRPRGDLRVSKPERGGGPSGEDGDATTEFGRIRMGSEPRRGVRLKRGISG